MIPVEVCCTLSVEMREAAQVTKLLPQLGTHIVSLEVTYFPNVQFFHENSLLVHCTSGNTALKLVLVVNYFFKEICQGKK